MIVFIVVFATNAPASADLKEVSLQVIACQDEATQRYIADFHQVGLPRLEWFDDVPLVVTRFQNNTPRFEEYVAECRKRLNSEAESR